MSDQAAGLRRLLERAPSLRVLGVFGADAGLTATATAHLALALARRGEPVWVLDEAGAPHNVATRFALPPAATLERLLREGGQADAALLAGPEGVQILAPGSGVAWLAGQPETRWQTVAERLAALAEQPQWILLHARTGLDTDGLALYAADRLLVTAERKTSLTQAYALLKGAQQQQPAERWRLLVMQASDADTAGQTHAALDGTARRFLGLGLTWSGVVPRDEQSANALRRLRPAQELPSASPTVKAFRQLAETLTERPDAPERCEPGEFWQKMWLFSRLSTEGDYHAGRAEGALRSRRPQVWAGEGKRAW